VIFGEYFFIFISGHPLFIFKSQFLQKLILYLNYMGLFTVKWTFFLNGFYSITSLIMVIVDPLWAQSDCLDKQDLSDEPSMVIVR